MRVLHIMSGFGGGISSFISNKAKYFQSHNVIFDVMTFDEVSSDFLETIRGTGGHVYRISNPKTKGIKNYYQEVNEVMKKTPPKTFIHCHIRGYRAIPFYLIAKKNGLKHFGIHAHTTGLPEEINSPKNRRMRLINSILANEKISCGVKASEYIFGEKYIKKNEVTHIPNSINPEVFISDLTIDKKSLLGENIRDKFIIGHIGRFRSVKNHLFMLSVIELLVDNGLDFIWLFAGDGDDFEKIKKNAHEKNLNQYIKFLGHRNDIPKLLQVMDLFVLPSKYEGFPTVAVESQASDTKTLLSDTITKEVDLELDLVNFLPISDPKVWAEYILSYQTKKKTNPTLRLNRLKDKKLTNKESAKLYQAFLKQTIEP